MFILFLKCYFIRFLPCNGLIVFSDKSTSYVDIEDYVEMHLTEKLGEETTKTTLKWVHIAISNAKRTFLDIYHKIDVKYLQNYLNEFRHKLNRRYFGDRLFDRLVVAVTYQYWHISFPLRLFCLKIVISRRPKKKSKTAAIKCLHNFHCASFSKAFLPLEKLTLFGHLFKL